MKLDKLRHVVTVDRAGAISKAAHSLNITQSAVTKNIAEIEKELGFALFERRARGVIATSEGREFIDRSARILSDLDQLVDETRDSRKNRETILRVGVCPTMIEGFLNRPVGAFVAELPDVRVHLRTFRVERGINMLRRGDVDLLVAPMSGYTSAPEFKWQGLGELRSRLFVHRDHPLAHQKNVTAEHVKSYPVIVPDISDFHTEQMMRFLNMKDDSGLRGLHVMGNFRIVCELVLKNNAIGVVSEGFGTTAKFLKNYRMIDIDIFDPLLMGCAHRANWLENHSARKFMHKLSLYPPG